MIFHWGLSDSKSPQVSRSLLSILADFNNAVVWIVSTHPLISKSSTPCTKPLVTVPSAPITVGITVTLMFHRFFFLLQGLTRWSAGTAKSTIQQTLFFITISSSGPLAEIKLLLLIDSFFTLVLTIFTNPSARAVYGTRSILNRSLTGLNSEFSFS